MSRRGVKSNIDMENEEKVHKIIADQKITSAAEATVSGSEEVWVNLRITNLVKIWKIQ